MADILIDNQGAPSTPAAGKSVVWVDQGTKKLAVVDDSGRVSGSLSRNDATTSQAPAAADTYITNSGILIPSFGMKAGQLYRWTIALSKTGAGVAATVVTGRIGANQSTADTARWTGTQGIAQAATATKGLLIVTIGVRNVGASGVLAGGFGFTHTNFGDGENAAAVGFDNTALAGQFFGLSINFGAASVYTIQHVTAELIG